MYKWWTLLAILPVFVQADFESAADAYRSNDFATAFEEFNPLATAGDARAQTVLALMYKYGEGVEQNLGLAVRWYRQAAELDYAPAQYHLGLMLASGQGVDEDRQAAINWLSRSAASGYELANSKLLELNADRVSSTSSHQAYVPWSKRWNLQLPNEIRFATPTEEMPEDARFRVQLGAMSSEQRALTLRDSLFTVAPDLFRELDFAVSPSDHPQPVYRLQAGPFRSLESARYFCDQLLLSGEHDGCLPLQAY